MRKDPDQSVHLQIGSRQEQKRGMRSGWKLTWKVDQEGPGKDLPGCSKYLESSEEQRKDSEKGNSRIVAVVQEADSCTSVYS